MNHEQPHAPTDEELIDQGIYWAHLNRLPIPDSTARRIAMQWHGGQSSALYSLGSSGAIDRERLDPELEEARRLCPSTLEGEQDADRLTWLSMYVQGEQDRGPVEGWERLTQDGQPAVMYLEHLRPEQFIGSYGSRKHLAAELMAATGVPRMLQQMQRQLGMSVMRYVTIDLDAYADDLSESVRISQNPAGGIDAYWRL